MESASSMRKQPSKPKVNKENQATQSTSRLSTGLLSSYPTVPHHFTNAHHQSTPCNLLNNKCTTSNISPESQAKQDAKSKRAERIAILKQRKISQRTTRNNITPIPFDISEAGTSSVNKPIITGISKDYKDEGDMCHKCSACGALLCGKNQNQPTSSKNTLDEELIKELMDMLDECNPLVKMYRNARDHFEKNPKDNFKIKLIARRSTDGRNYNLPFVEEVAALVVSDIDLNFDKRDIVVHSISEGLKRISELHPQYLALQYPLLFAYAEDGYRPDIDHQDVDGTTTRIKKKVSMSEFFAYKIQDRSELTLAHMARKLHQQLLVDAYTMIESERIHYIRINPKIQRADTFAHLTLANLSGDVINSMLGNRVKLPASFTGSARYMLENYRDATALCRVYGYPDLFITFTCNSKWPAITRALEGTGFTPEDKPEYQGRVFKMKLDRLMEDIKKNKIFGKVQAYLYTIEFQKRGLPHAHICIFLHESDKLPEPEDVDEYISAELPDKEEDTELYQLVTELMIHGPCGEKNPTCPCTDIEKKCMKRFPKAFADITSVDHDGYLIYRRREDGRTVIKQGHELDNRNVVPYNAFLLRKYQAHINVEWCNQVGAIRYLFKYINKGNDRVTAGLCDEEIDEIKEYNDYRYISSCEAVWRILKFDIHNQNPTVIRLAFHLEDQHSIIFDEEDFIKNVLDQPLVNTSQFLEWMKCNQACEEARQLTYVEFPTNFVWNKQIRLWTNRKRFTGSIGRIHHAPPITGELFYLRILLNKVKGPTSYEDIRTVDGKVCSTFKNACFEMGLLDDEQEYIDGIKDVSTWESGHFVRNLFAQLLHSNSLSRPEDVFEKTFDYLSVEIIPHRLSGVWEAIDRSLRDICRTVNPNSNETLFGGKVVVFGGDFRQVLPVITHGKREDIMDASLNSSYIWDHVTVLKLTVNMRLSNASLNNSDEDNKDNFSNIRKFVDWLLDVGNGNVNPSEDGISEIEMAEDVLVKDM
ncbi:uncharacterized protein [Rutidosis leptorrhynchoides]|uniref:uncharacterized protein n=1 Tax=Rutidosis leptorrhynchoides TaxID=125765 RepID=UPI003A99EF36